MSPLPVFLCTERMAELMLTSEQGQQLIELLHNETTLLERDPLFRQEHKLFTQKAQARIPQAPKNVRVSPQDNDPQERKTAPPAPLDVTSPITRLATSAIATNNNSSNTGLGTKAVARINTSKRVTSVSPSTMPNFSQE